MVIQKIEHPVPTYVIISNVSKSVFDRLYTSIDCYVTEKLRHYQNTEELEIATDRYAYLQWLSY